MHHSPTTTSSRGQGQGEAPRCSEMSASWEVILLPSSSNNGEGPETDCPPAFLLEPGNMPPSWRDEYLASLREAEKNSPVNKDLVVACMSTTTAPLSLQYS